MPKQNKPVPQTPDEELDTLVAHQVADLHESGHLLAALRAADRRISERKKRILALLLDLEQKGRL